MCKFSQSAQFTPFSYGLTALQRACAAIATHINMNSTVPITQNKRWSQASGGTGAGGFVARLLCTAYLGKLAILFDCTSPQQA